MTRWLLLLCCAFLCACQPIAPGEPAKMPAKTPEESAQAARTLRHYEATALETPTPLFSPPAAVSADAANISPASMGLSSWTELGPALQCSLGYAEQWYPDDVAVMHSGQVITWRQVVASLRRLNELLPGLDADTSPLAAEFQWISINPDVRFTGYYTPVFEARYQREPGFATPIYRLPEELAPELAQCLPFHDCPDSAFTGTVIRPDTPFLSRAAIDLDGALSGRGMEMAWLEHPMDTYELMLEGSGMLVFPDGSRRMAQFAGLNGNPGQGLLGYLIRTGQLPRHKASMGNARRWWDENPSRRRALLNAASSYVFFRYSRNNTALGTAGCSLTPWVSMAVDPTVLPLGGIVAYALPGQPVNGGVRQGLGFAQDTGGAIRWRRIDMFTGQGQAGNDQAMRISTLGQAWLLLLRNS